MFKVIRCCAALATILLTIACAGGCFAAPGITGIAENSVDIAQYDKLQIDFGVQTVATELFWPYDPSPAANSTAHPNAVPAGRGVSVDGLFLPPGQTDWSKAIVQPGFYIQPFSDTDTNPNPYPVGAPHWEIRFAPTALGAWKYKISVQDSGGVTSSEERSFNCTQGTSPGFVRVSSNDCRYFETSNGNYLSLCGLNSAVPTESNYADLQANGINLLRPWWNASQGPVLFGLSGQGGVPDINYIVNGSWSSTPVLSGTVKRPGDLCSGMMQATGDTAIRMQANVKPNTTYKFSAWVKTVGLAVSAGGGVFLNASPCTRSDADLTSRLTGDNDWTQMVGTITTQSSQKTIDYLKINLKGRTAGAAYYTDMSLREVTGDGTLGGEILRSPSYNKHRYVSQLSAYEADKQVELARQHSIYLKIVLEDKEDIFFGNIMPDGSFGSYFYHNASLYDNVRASATHASRTYQTYFWRYMIARYGYATSIHSFELFNEDDPFNSNHYAAAAALADYFNNNAPNKQLCSTSNWHSYPTSEFWANPSYSAVGYSDWHQYIGDQPGSSLQFRYGWGFGNTSGTTWAWLDGVTTYLDDSTCVSPPCSLHIHGVGNANGLTMIPVAIAPGHSYTLSWKLKGQGLITDGTKAGSPSWVKGPTMMFVMKTGWWGTEINRIIPDLGDNMGTYDWKSKSYTFAAPDNANYIDLEPTIQWAVGDCWFDDISLHDDTAGRIIALPNSSFDEAYRKSERDSRLDYDTAVVNASIGAQVGTKSTRSKKAPCIRGELGISGANAYGNPYKTAQFVGENQQLVDDTEGVWYRKLVWGQINPYGVIDLYWWDTNIKRYGLLKYVKAYQSFMAGVPLSNGHYEDACATTSANTIRAWGQKDLTGNCAHLWIDNAPYTWKAVVDHNYNPEPWSSVATYAKNSTCGSGSPTHIYKSLQDNNNNHAVSDSAWWQDLGAYTPSNPPLPDAANGTVTVSGLKDGTYVVEWWNTTAGAPTRTEDVTCTNGNVVLSVVDLQSDIACKITPKEPKIDVNVTVPAPQVVPGQIVTVTVHFANNGETEARRVAVATRVPATMTYVDGSAEATGGTYSAATGAVTWIVESVAPHQSGIRSFQARVQ